MPLRTQDAGEATWEVDFYGDIIETPLFPFTLQAIGKVFFLKFIITMRYLPDFSMLFLCILLNGCVSSPKQEIVTNTRHSASEIIHEQMKIWHDTPYHLGGTTHRGIDCSGLVWHILHDGFKLPMHRVTTHELIHDGILVDDKNRLQPGDLVFFRIKNKLHVGMFDIDNKFIHASHSKGVIYSSLSNPYWQHVYLEARRLSELTMYSNG